MRLGPGKRPIVSAFAVCVLGSLGLIPSAQASTVTLGSSLTASFSQSSLCGSLCTIAQSELPGAVVASPSDGTVVRWRVKAASGPGGFRLRVLHPEGFGAYTGVGTSATGTPVSFGTQVFATQLPISAGDLVGLDPTDPNGTIGIVGTPNSKSTEWISSLADGSTRGSDGTISIELAYNADVRPVPGVASLSPSSGPVAGGTSVTIAGHDFEGTTAVSFGGTPAASFAVDSDSQITAVSPGGPAGSVDVRVENPGESPVVSSDVFSYAEPPVVVGCVVPNLKGKTLKKARVALKKAHCRLGKVSPKGNRKLRRRGRVVKQSPKAGVSRSAGAKVNVKLGAKRQRHRRR
jgi:IPT/TIG domain/PASTA domain